MFLAGSQVWDTAVGKVHDLEGGRQKDARAAISPDGAWIAVAGKAQHATDNPVTVYDAATGKRRFTAPGDPKRLIDLVVLSNDRLLVGNPQVSELQIWNLQTGQQEKTVKLSTANSGVTLDGKYLATLANSQMVVMRTDTGKIVATMASPKPPEPQTPKPAARPTPRRASGLAKGSDATFGDLVNSRIRLMALTSVKFSPDGKELAAVSEWPKPHLICWSNSGKLMSDEPIQDENPIWDCKFQWFPGRDAWLIGSEVVDRQSRLTVLYVDKPFDLGFRAQVLDQGRLVYQVPDDTSKIRVVPVPWEQIRQSLACIKAKGPAFLSPSDPPGMKFEFADVLGTKDGVGWPFRKGLTLRLAEEGLKLADNRPTYFRLTFSEKAGRAVMLRQYSPGNPGVQDTVRQGTEVDGTLVVELMLPGRAEPVWRDTLSATSDLNFYQDITDDLVRRSMIGNLAVSMRRLRIPCFIPESDELLTLPVVIGGK